LDFSAEFSHGDTEFWIVLVEQFCGAFQELNVSLFVIDHLHWGFHCGYFLLGYVRVDVRLSAAFLALPFFLSKETTCIYSNSSFMWLQMNIKEIMMGKGGVMIVCI
jgi:hypothetical protein